MKTNNFELNGKTITAVPFTYNLICDLDDMGISIAEISEKPNAFVRTYVALCIGTSKENAGKEIESHLIAGGKLDPIIEAMTKEMNNSDFFQALSKNAEKNNQKN